MLVIAENGVSPMGDTGRRRGENLRRFFLSLRKQNKREVKSQLRITNFECGQLSWLFPKEVRFSDQREKNN